MRRPVILALSLLALCSLAVPAIAAAPVDVPAKFANVLSKVRKKSKVAVRLPSSLNAGVKPSRVYGAVEELSRGRYHLSLGAARGCHEATACFIAAFFGQDGGALVGTRKVSLAHGISGRFDPISCGASCAPAQLGWKQHGVAYTIQFKGSKRQLVRLANSAIRGGAR
jgi:hypothetical protein